ncbi:RepB family plasmid replication initiator protein (plasmid) [Limimaricola variabilis]
MAKLPQPSYRTVDARPTPETLIKPGELVDLIEVTPLTLADRRIYNQLLENAWEAIDKPVMHVIAKSDLRGNHNSNDRIGDSIERLMSAIVKMEVIWDGKPAIERVQLLGGNVEMARSDGLFEYEIPARLRKVITNSTVFARLQREVMFALSSKYALTLYEMVQKRGNLRWKSSESFTLDGIRAVLGVPKGKLTSWSNLRLRAIDPAVAEVCALSDYMVEIAPIKTGRSVTHVELRWWRKDGDATDKAERSLSFASTGRRARAAEEARGQSGATTIPGQTPPRPRPAWLDRQGEALRTETYETARLRFPGYDIYNIEGQWREWSKSKSPAEDPDRAFLAFFRKFVEANPI